MQWQMIATLIVSISTVFLLTLIVRAQRISKQRVEADLDREARATMILLSQDEIIGRLLDAQTSEIGPLNVHSSHSAGPCSGPCADRQNTTDL